MFSDTGESEPSSRRRFPRGGFQYFVRGPLVKGAALTIPLVLTLIILSVVVDFLLQTLNPVVAAANLLWPGEIPDPLVQAGTVLGAIAVVYVVGFVSQETTGRRMASGFHTVMEAVPGVGSVYASFRRMSEVMIESDTESFQDVKVVEFPATGTYSLGFLTGRSRGRFGDILGREDETMCIMFMPLAPNPVMGGYLVYVPEEHVWDVDMTVEEAVQALVTSGVAASKKR